MKHRLSHLKRCQQYHITKYSRSSSPVNTRSTLRSLHGGDLVQPSPYYDPLRHYENVLIEIPSHFNMPNVGTLYMHSLGATEGISSHTEDQDHNRFSDKEVVVDVDALPKLRSGTAFLEEVKSQDGNGQEGTQNPESLSVGMEQPNAQAPPGGLKRSHSTLSSISSSSSVRRLSIRLSSRTSQSLRHVNSVLSRSNSWRSSILYAKSIATSTNSNPLSDDEFRAWDDWIDESGLLPRIPQPRDYELMSLFDRSCCHFSVESHPLSRCPKCGFAQQHQRARSMLIGDHDKMDTILPLDRFGNTPLHHAAAAGNWKTVLQMTNNIPPSASQNTSGETYLHVFRVDEDKLSKYLFVLETTSRPEFFSIKDFQGRNVAQRFLEWAATWDSQHSIFTDILDVFKSHGLQFVNTSENPEEIGILSSALDTIAEERAEQTSDIFPNNIISPALNKWVYKPDSDPHGGKTQLSSTLANWPTSSRSPGEMKILAQEADINMRDARGYTVLAMAARHGLRDVVLQLLYCGANPNSRSYQGTSVLAHSGANLARAHKIRDDRLYAGILSCIVALTDHGAKPKPSVYDEFGLFIPSHSQPPANISSLDLPATEVPYTPFHHVFWPPLSEEGSSATLSATTEPTIQTLFPAQTSLHASKMRRSTSSVDHPRHITPFNPDEVSFMAPNAENASFLQAQIENVDSNFSAESYEPSDRASIRSESHENEPKVRTMDGFHQVDPASILLSCVVDAQSVARNQDLDCGVSSSCNGHSSSYATSNSSSTLSHYCGAQIQPLQGFTPLLGPHSNTTTIQESSIASEGNIPNETRFSLSRTSGHSQAPNIEPHHSLPTSFNEDTPTDRQTSLTTVQSCSCPVISHREGTRWSGLENPNFRNYKSSDIKFLSWLAHTLKHTSSSIPPDERKTCPLLWCRKQFPDQESMLKHVWECKSLSREVFWCCKCLRPEIFPGSDTSSGWSGRLRLRKALKEKEMEAGIKLYPSCDRQNDRRPTSVEAFGELWGFGR